MTFDDTPRERQCQTEPATFLIERAGVAIVCSLYVAILGDDNNSRAPSVAQDAAAIRDDRQVQEVYLGTGKTFTARAEARP